jgi:hypothetical protein
MAGDQLPGYTAQASPSTQRSPELPAHAKGTEHTYALESKGRKWLTLKVTNSRATNTTQLPAFVEADTIEGVVEIDADKPENSKGITISVCPDALFTSSTKPSARRLLQAQQPLGRKKRYS